MFSQLLHKGVLVFIDDILVYSLTLEDHVLLVCSVFHILEENQMKIRRSKCAFASNQLKYLRHVISEEGAQIDPANIDKV